MQLEAEILRKRKEYLDMQIDNVYLKDYGMSVTCIGSGVADRGGDGGGGGGLGGGGGGVGGGGRGGGRGGGWAGGGGGAARGGCEMRDLKGRSTVALYPSDIERN